MFNYLHRLFIPASQPVHQINHDKTYRKNNMALKNTNKSASFSTLSTNLVKTLDALALSLNDADCSDNAACAGIFAVARQVRITARAAGILSRFDRQVNQSEFSGVFNDFDYNFTKWSTGTPSPVRG